MSIEKKFIKIGIVSISDRASKGIYLDLGVPTLRDWCEKVILGKIVFQEKLIPDDFELIKSTLIDLCDLEHCDLILTTGGTGPSLRDVTPDATEAIADKILPGFGEQMRQISLHFVPTAILSRQTAVIRNKSLIINLPGQPKAIQQTLEGLKDSEQNIIVHGIFAAIPYCIELIGGPFIETNDYIVKAFRPKK
ncbi:MAG: molybdopterin adenylyltransferase [Proteobacteria bacterium]|jgi:molybdopterin adenylyltransferase|nr:molybdopterin adenylyltransferase [Pseudomonadota bacterium]MDA0941399.1 molybdopterin adenylyltransferase [Pseudomonadota bacterium]MDA1033985.1 molybdopterin adenylyltransferase [Pseudomonadota bacterium]